MHGEDRTATSADPVAAEAMSPILSFFKYQQLLAFLCPFFAAVCSY